MDSREVSEAEDLLRQELAQLQREYSERAKPIINKLAELDAMKPPKPAILDYAAIAANINMNVQAYSKAMVHIYEPPHHVDCSKRCQPEPLEHEYAFEVGQHVAIHAGCYDGENGHVLSRSRVKGKNFYDLEVITGQWVTIKPVTLIFEDDLRVE
jgi:hypothetical protein